MTLSEANRLLSRLVPEAYNVDECRRVAGGLRKVVILKTSWYGEILDGLEKSAREFLKAVGVPDAAVSTQPVPGSFELPLAARYLTDQARDPADLVVALGCVLKGDTPHFDYVCQSVTQGLMDVMLESGVPVGFGVLTVNSMDQAVARASKGAEAAQAALLMKVLACRIGDGKYGL